MPKTNELRLKKSKTHQMATAVLSTLHMLSKHISDRKIDLSHHFQKLYQITAYSCLGFPLV